MKKLQYNNILRKMETLIQLQGNIELVLYFYRQVVNPNIMIPNNYIKQATEHYLER